MKRSEIRRWRCTGCIPAVGEDESGILTFFYNPVSGAYFNVQEEVEPGIEWALRCSGFRRWTRGNLHLQVDFETVLEFPFTLGVGPNWSTISTWKPTS